MSQVIDFLNTNIRFMSRFPGTPSHGNFSDRGVEFHSDAIISMEESGEGEYDFIVLRLELFVNQNGDLESTVKLIFDSPANEDSSEFWIPMNEAQSFEQTILAYLASCGITEELDGDGLALARGIDLLKHHFSGVIEFTTHARKLAA